MAASSKPDYKTVAINASVSAIATAVTLWALNYFSKKSPAGMGLPRKVLANLSLQKQAHFADAHTMLNVANSKFLLEHLPDPGTMPEQAYANLNARQVGNLAFVALHSPDQEIRRRSMEILLNFKKYA